MDKKQSIHPGLVNVIPFPIIELSLKIKSTLGLIFTRLGIPQFGLYPSPTFQFDSVHFQRFEPFVQIVDSPQRIFVLLWGFGFLFLNFKFLLPFDTGVAFWGFG